MKAGFVELDIDEEIIAIVKKSILLELSRLIFGFIWIILPFFFFFSLMKLELTGVIFFVLIELAGVWYTFRIWNIWRLSMLIVTDRRVIDLHQASLFKREIHELWYKQIKSVKVKKIGVVGLLNLGALRVHTKKGEKFDLEFYGLKNPGYVRDLILEVKCLITGETAKVKKTNVSEKTKVPSKTQAIPLNVEEKTVNKKAE